MNKKASWNCFTRNENVNLWHLGFIESFAEMTRGRNEWETGVGTVLSFLGFAALVLIWEKQLVCGPARTSLTKWMLDMEVSPTKGFST